MCAFGVDVTRQEVRSFQSEVVWKQVELQGQSVSSLGVAADAAVFSDVLLNEGGLDSLELALVLLRLCDASKRFAGSGYKQRGISKKCGANEVFGSVRADGEPIPIVPTPVFCADELLRVPAHVIDPSDHPRQMLFKDALVIVNLVDCPGANNARVTPARNSPSWHGVWTHITEGAVGGLAIRNVAKPLGEKGRHVAVVCCSSTKDLGVAHPAKTLVALGAIHWNAQEIPPLAPLDVRLKLIDARVGTGERATAWNIRPDDHTREGLSGGFALKTGKLDVTETVKSETGLPKLNGITFAGVMVNRGCATQILGVECAVRIKHLGVTQRHGCATGSGDFEPDYPHDILPEVEHPAAWLGLAYRFWFEFADFAHRLR